MSSFSPSFEALPSATDTSITATVSSTVSSSDLVAPSAIGFPDAITVTWDSLAPWPSSTQDIGSGSVEAWYPSKVQVINDGTLLFDDYGQWGSSKIVHLILQFIFVAAIVAQLAQLGRRVYLAQSPSKVPTFLLGSSIVFLIISYLMGIGTQIGWNYSTGYYEEVISQTHAIAARLIFYFIPDSFLLAAAYLFVFPFSNIITGFFLSAVIAQCLLVLGSTIAAWGVRVNISPSSYDVPVIFWVFSYAAQIITAGLALSLIALLFINRPIHRPCIKSDMLRSFRRFFAPAVGVRTVLSLSVALVGGLGGFSSTYSYNTLVVVWDIFNGIALVVIIYVLTRLVDVPKVALENPEPNPLAPANVQTVVVIHNDIEKEILAKAFEEKEKAKNWGSEGATHLEKIEHAQKIKEALLANGTDPTRSPNSVSDTLPAYNP